MRRSRSASQRMTALRLCSHQILLAAPLNARSFAAEKSTEL
jgi:hypothetical protein